MIWIFSLVPLNISFLFIPQEHCRFQKTFLAASRVNFFLCFIFFSLLSRMSKDSSGGVYATWDFSQFGLPYVCVFSKVSSEKGFVFSCMWALSFCHLFVLSPSFTERVNLSSTPCKSGQWPWHCTVPTWNACVPVGKGSRSHPFLACVWSSPALLWTWALPWADAWIRQYPGVPSGLGCSLILSWWDRL